MYFTLFGGHEYFFRETQLQYFSFFSKHEEKKILLKLFAIGYLKSEE